MVSVEFSSCKGISLEWLAPLLADTLHEVFFQLTSGRGADAMFQGCGCFGEVRLGWRGMSECTKGTDRRLVH